MAYDQVRRQTVNTWSYGWVCA